MKNRETVVAYSWSPAANQYTASILFRYPDGKLELITTEALPFSSYPDAKPEHLAFAEASRWEAQFIGEISTQAWNELPHARDRDSKNDTDFMAWMCPACDNTEKFNVTTRVTMQVYRDDGVSEPDEIKFDNLDGVSCPECDARWFVVDVAHKFPEEA